MLPIHLYDVTFNFGKPYLQGRPELTYVCDECIHSSVMTFWQIDWFFIKLDMNIKSLETCTSVSLNSLSSVIQVDGHLNFWKEVIKCNILKCCAVIDFLKICNFYDTLNCRILTSIMTTLQTGWMAFNFRLGLGIFPHAITSRLALGPSQPPVWWLQVFFPMW
jgi:hypothetical protein